MTDKDFWLIEGKKEKSSRLITYKEQSDHKGMSSKLTACMGPRPHEKACSIKWNGLGLSFFKADATDREEGGRLLLQA